MPIKKYIRTIPDYPKPGIQFRDITTLIQDPVGKRMVTDMLCQRYLPMDFDIIAGIEARGFIMGGALSYAMGTGFIPVRKKGKLPGEVVSQEYDLEYGTDSVEIHKDAIKPGDKILLVDDLLATGGTAEAAASLVKKLGGEVVEIAFIVNLPDLGGEKRLNDQGYKTFCITEFEGD